MYQNILFVSNEESFHHATAHPWETDLNKSSRLLSESHFINSVIDCMYALVCTHVKSLSNKICLN